MKTRNFWRQLGIFCAVLILLAGLLLIGNYIVFKSWMPALTLCAVIALMGSYFVALYLSFTLIISSKSYKYMLGGVSLFLLLLITLFTTTRWIIYTFYPLLGIELYDPDIPFHEEVFRSRMLRNFVFLTMLAGITSFFSHRVGVIRELKKEAKSLRHQFSNAHLYPHFVESITATAIGRSIFKATKGTQDALIHLAEVMRYVLDVQAEPQKLVPLNQELNHVLNLMEIADWKYGQNSIVYDLNVKDFSTIKTIPCGMLTLVENAIKYTPFKKNEACKIFIKLTVEVNCFKFSCINPVEEGTIKKGSGFGLKNLRERIAQSGLPIRLMVEETDDRFIATWEQDLK